MCSHVDCRVEVLPDESVVEEHVFTEEQIETVDLMIGLLNPSFLTTTTWEVGPDGKSGTSP